VVECLPLPPEFKPQYYSTAKKEKKKKKKYNLPQSHNIVIKPKTIINAIVSCEVQSIFKFLTLLGLGFESGLCTAKQVLYHLSHTPVLCALVILEMEVS
jgi:hypothetical protein